MFLHPELESGMNITSPQIREFELRRKQIAKELDRLASFNRFFDKDLPKESLPPEIKGLVDSLELELLWDTPFRVNYIPDHKYYGKVEPLIDLSCPVLPNNVRRIRFKANPRAALTTDRNSDLLMPVEIYDTSSRVMGSYERDTFNTPSVQQAELIRGVFYNRAYAFYHLAVMEELTALVVPADS